MTDATQHIRIEEIGAHAVQAQRALFGADAMAFQARLQHSAKAIIVELPHDIARIDAELIRRDFGLYLSPRDPQRVDGV